MNVHQLLVKFQVNCNNYILYLHRIAVDTEDNQLYFYHVQQYGQSS